MKLVSKMVEIYNIGFAVLSLSKFLSFYVRMVLFFFQLFENKLSTYRQVTPKYSSIYFFQIRTLSCITNFCLWSKGSICRLCLVVLFLQSLSNWNSSWAFSWFSSLTILNIVGQLFYKMCLHLVLSDVFSCLDSDCMFSPGWSQKDWCILFAASQVELVFGLST